MSDMVERVARAMTSEMIERVARAVCKAFAMDYHSLREIDANFEADKEWENWIPEAKAAIAAMQADAAPKGPHPSHQTRVSLDSSSYDEICEKCGATDGIGTWGALAEPCKAMQADAAPGWMPIDTAPTDWKEIIVYSPDHESSNTGGICSAFCDPDNGWFTHTHGGNMKLNPTHWMPLPAAPVTAPVSTPKPVDDRGSAKTSDKLRDAVGVFREASDAATCGSVKYKPSAEQAAAAVIEADRAALVAEIVAGLRDKAIIHRSMWGMSVDPRTEELAAYVEAKWGGK